MNAEGPLNINLHEILRKRGVKAPGFLVSLVERVIHQRELNEMLQVGWPARGSEFAGRILRYLDVTVEAEGLDSLPEGRYMFASNHPLGGLDGVSLIWLLGRKYGDEGVRFLVNDMLMNVEPLSDVFLPINKYGSQGRKAAAAINEAMASDMQILQFPAGLVSRLLDDGEIADLEWQKSFVAKAIESQRDIVPVHFIALNRKRFYRLARLRKKLGIKVNLEQAMLPAEMCATRGERFRVVFGSPVSWQSLRDSGKSPRELAADLRAAVYRL